MGERANFVITASIFCLFVFLPSAFAQSTEHDNPRLDPVLTLPIDETVFFGAVSDADMWPDGRFAVLDRQAYSIYVFDESGAIVDTVGREGAGPGEVRIPMNIAISPDGDLAAVDIGNARIMVWSQNGDYKHTFRIAPGFSSTRHLEWNQAGIFFKTAAFGQGELSFERLEAGTDSNSKVFSLPLDDGGLSGETTCVFCAFSVTSPGRPLVAANDTIYALFELGSEGEILKTYSRQGVPAVRRSDREYEELRGVLRRGPPGGGTRSGRPSDPSRFKVRMRAVSVDSQNRVWIQLNAEDGTGSVFDVFDSEAAFLGRLTLPEQVLMLRIVGDFLLASSENEIGEPVLKVYEVSR